MIRKKRYLAAKMGLLALGLMLLFPGQAEAADKKTIYNSPYVSFSPDGKAFTTCAGDQNYTWMKIGMVFNSVHKNVCSIIILAGRHSVPIVGSLWKTQIYI